MNRDTEKLARKVRLHVLDMITDGGSSHIASVLSVVDILAVLYGKILRVNPKSPSAPGRDRFILSKGHAGAGVYATLAECGFFDTKILKQHYKNGSLLSGHISHKGIPGIEWSTGSLGHGLPVAVGIAKAAKLARAKYRVFVIISDGECQEGTTWEAALFAAQHQLDNLCVIIDYNKMQCIAPIADTLEIEPLREKWKSFGFSVKESGGHSHAQLVSALLKVPFDRSKPSVLIAHTKRGKGVSFMEKEELLWYFRTPNATEYQAAKKELEK